MCHQLTKSRGTTIDKNRGSLQVTLMKQPSFRLWNLLLYVESWSIL
jgi:hypothetical protein